jgi:hypothetical protein
MRPLSELPGWNFDLKEVSAGVFQVTATDTNGRRVQHTGTDPDAVLAECRATAERIAREVAHRSR